VQVCPTDALVMTRAPERPADHREDLFLTMKKLYENGEGRDHGWASGSKLMGMQEGEKKKKPEKEVAA
jgi:formate hydrogenlyase subunit 6/NADH:ubiquinone oxidoreductase subunit I